LASQSIIQELIEILAPATPAKKEIRYDASLKDGQGTHQTAHAFPGAPPNPQRSIAIVEDERDLLSTYSAVFRSLGWRNVFPATDGEMIVQAVKSAEILPDIVIMDYRLPGMDGIDAARRIHRRVPKAKIIITTADDRVKGEAESSGFYFLQKPFTISELVSFLKEI